MLASFKDYAFVWQLPLIGIFIVGWVLGGGWLLRLRLKRLQNKKLTFARCIVASMLSGLCAAFAAAAIMMMIRGIGIRMEMHLTIPGAIVGAVVGLVVVYMVLLTVFNLPLGKILLYCSPAVAGVAVLAAGIGAACYFPASKQVRETNMVGWCEVNLRQIDGFIRKYEVDARATLKSLDVLQAKYPKEIGPHLKCPADKSPRPESYCYLSTSSLPPPVPGAAISNKIRLCDYKSNHGDKGRGVMMIDGTYRWLNEAEFQTLLAKPENKPFAEKLQKEDP